MKPIDPVIPGGQAGAGGQSIYHGDQVIAGGRRHDGFPVPQPQTAPPRPFEADMTTESRERRQSRKGEAAALEVESSMGRAHSAKLQAWRVASTHRIVRSGLLLLFVCGVCGCGPPLGRASPTPLGFSFP